MRSSFDERGMILVVVLLITAVVLLSVVTTAAVTALGTRTGSSNERVAYQALLSAESGINSFVARISALPASQRYRGQFTYGTAEQKAQTLEALNTWLIQNDLVTLTLDETHQTTLSIVDVKPGNMITLQSSSTVGNARGHKVVLQELTISRLAGMNMRIPAALTSWPTINVRGNSTVAGQDAATATGIIEGITVTSANVTVPNDFINPVSFNLNVQDSTHISKNAFVHIGGHTYYVEDRTGNTLRLRTMGPVTESGGRAIASNTQVGLIPYAAIEDVTIQNAFRVSNVSGFMVSDVVYAGSLPFKGTVTEVDYLTGFITVDWNPGPNMYTPLAKGTPLRRAIYGAASSGSVSTDGNNATIEDGKSPHDTSIDNPFHLDPTQTLFYQTFGITKEAFAESVPLTPTASFNGTVNGLLYIDGNKQLTGDSRICGTGILVIKGDLTINGSCDAGFKGLIYVMGNYRQQGNSVISGAVVVEGTVETGNPSDDSTVAGTGDGAKLEFNERALLEASYLIAPVEFGTVIGTWRQQ